VVFMRAVGVLSGYMYLVLVLGFSRWGGLGVECCGFLPYIAFVPSLLCSLSFLPDQRYRSELRRKDLQRLEYL
jgi:hypothetical protein